MNFPDIPRLAEWKTASFSWTSMRSTNLKRIDALIEKYHMVMATSRVNILAELMATIRDWSMDKYDRNEGSRRLPAMKALETVVIAKLTALNNLGGHRYTRVVCIGYVVKTGEYDQGKAPMTPTDRTNDESTDIRERCRELVKAIRVAAHSYAASTAGQSEDQKRACLKIFMAPEFFFRGPYGAYASVGAIPEIFDTMLGETAQDIYADWLFVFGSAICTSDKEVSGVKQGNLLENYALVQRGGSDCAGLRNVVVAKEFPSHIDFKHPGVSNLQWFDPATSRANVAGVSERHFMPEGARRDPLSADDWNYRRVSELVGGTIFTMDGIRFGLEVCRDHYLGRLARSKEAGSVHVQLIPSAGMTIEPGSIACLPDGVVFNVDGVTPHAQLKVGPAPVQDTTAAAQSRKIGAGHVHVFASSALPLPGAPRTHWPRSL